MKQLVIGYGLMLLTLPLSDCSASLGLAPSAQAQSSDPAPLQPYGREGAITQAELALLQGLAWPQTYDDMINSFGYPYYRTETADYYQVEGDRRWVAIHYNGTTATGFSAVDDPER